jgi:hypothetical protein
MREHVTFSKNCKVLGICKVKLLVSCRNPIGSSTRSKTSTMANCTINYSVVELFRTSLLPEHLSFFDRWSTLSPTWRYLTATSTALVKATANDTDTASVVMTSRVNHLHAVFVCRSMSADNSFIQLLATWIRHLPPPGEGSGFCRCTLFASQCLTVSACWCPRGNQRLVPERNAPTRRETTPLGTRAIGAREDSGRPTEVLIVQLEFWESRQSRLAHVFS